MYGGGTGVMMEDCKGEEYASARFWSVSRSAQFAHPFGYQSRLRTADDA